MIGTVKFFNLQKGFGFITQDNEDKDVFVHSSGIVPGTEITEGDRVSFDIEESDRGPKATNVDFED